MAELVPQSLQDMGPQGWTASPKFASPLWRTIYSTLVLGVGIGVLAQPQLVVRFMTVKSDKELNRGIVIGTIFNFVSVGTAIIVGTLSNVFFFSRTGKIVIQ